MNITNEKLNEIANAVKLLGDGDYVTSVNLDDKYRVVFNLYCCDQILIYLEERDENGEWSDSCTIRKGYAPYANIPRLLEIVEQYIENFYEEKEHIDSIRYFPRRCRVNA